ncbi:hypothetical protein CDL12_12475 [Handroanthus impetiginosus]|uniref:Uncharacterized protein n=1 Tax=Handroanthus impetiginosus TaxID=429701 RepID=A0A2G9HBK1_9LAMI|nr:hypothetical protein CDL12_12475 [Handroanthus impetiginosus]
MYGEDPACDQITLTIFYGGKCDFNPPCVYCGGKVAKFDFFLLDILSFRNLNYVCNSIQVENPRKFFKKVDDAFILILDEKDLKEYGRFCAKFGEVKIYVEIEAVVQAQPNAQPKSQPSCQPNSTPQAQPNAQPNSQPNSQPHSTPQAQANA